MLARDIMTTDVCELMPDTSVLEAAQLFVDRRIGGAPVLDDAGQVVGVVSEGDLMRRAELGTERVWSGWREFLAGKDMVAHEFVRSHAFKVGDIMSAPVWTAHEDMPLVRKIVSNVRDDDYRLSAVLLEIVASAPFQMRIKSAGPGLAAAQEEKL